MLVELTTREAWAIAEVIKGRKNLTKAYANLIDAAHAAEVMDFDCMIENAGRANAKRCNSQCETCRAAA